jgi:hypothetical protein
MISDPALYRRRDRLLPVAFALSLLLHVFGIAAFRLVAGHFPWVNPPKKHEPIVVLSSATTISRITVPHLAHPVERANRSLPAQRPEPRMVQQRPQRPVPQQRLRQVAAAPPPAYREVTVPAPSASPMPSPAPSHPAERTAPRLRRAQQQQQSHESPAQRLAQMLAREQPSYRREIAQLQRQDNPLSAATISPRPPSAFRREYINVSGIDLPGSHYNEGIVTGIERWREDGLNCYYANYVLEYYRGGTESGTIPWPLCYAPDHDMMELGEGALIPKEYLAPMRDYVLPPGTYLTPFLQYLYEEPRR